jgi:hypothetical protein
MRRLVICFASLWLAVSSLAAAEKGDPSAKDILSLQGKALFETAWQISDPGSKFSQAELMAITAKLVAEERNLAKDDIGRPAVNSFFEAACRHASPDQVQRLCELFAQLDPIRFVKSSLVTPLAVGRITQDLVELRKEGARPEFADTHPAVPEKIADLPKNLIEAWKAYQKVEQPYYDRFFNLSRENAISFYDNQKSFFRLMDDVMAGRGENLAEKLNAYQLYGYGNGLDLYPKFIGMFASLLHDRRLAEAAGASLALPQESIVWNGAVPLSSLRIEFLKVCGIDWEEVLAGAEVNHEARTEPIGAYNGRRHQFWREIATYGSERGARMLGQLASIEKANLRPEDIQALGAFLKTDRPLPVLEPKGPLLTSAKFDEIKRVSSDPISKEVQADLLQTLMGRLEDNSSAEVAMAAVELFTYMRGPQVSAALQSLAAHPSPEVAENAARVLRARYEKVDVQTRPASGPVRFQLYVNGEPAPKEMRVNCGVNFEGSGSGGGVEVEKDGTFQMNREYFLDPTRKPIGILVSKGATAEDKLFFAVSVPVPADLDAVTRVDVQTVPLQLTIDASEGFVRPVGQQAHIQFKRLEGPPLSGGSICAQFDVPVKGPIELSSIQPGTYDLNLFVSGAERWHDTITVGPKLRRVNVKLRPGADLHVEIVPPTGTTRRVDFVLLHEGREIDPWSVFDSETKTYRGLPCGNYWLRVPASRDQPWERLGWPPPGPDEVPYRALDVPFTIAANSAFVDLGELHLSAAR